MTRIIQSLSQIGGDYDVLFCDLWGCLHNGKQPYPAAVAALQAFRQGGGKVVLMTNAPRPNQFVIAQLDRMGVPRASVCLELSEKHQSTAGPAVSRMVRSVRGNGLRIAVEAAATYGWERYVGERGAVVGMTGFGASAPHTALYEHFGITPEKVAELARTRLG